MVKHSRLINKMTGGLFDNEPLVYCGDARSKLREQCSELAHGYWVGGIDSLKFQLESDALFREYGRGDKEQWVKTLALHCDAAIAAWGWTEGGTYHRDWTAIGGQ